MKSCVTANVVREITRTRLGASTGLLRYNDLCQLYGEICHYCGKPSEQKLDLHHVNSQISDNSLQNLRLACRSCNLKLRQPQFALNHATACTVCVIKTAAHPLEEVSRAQRVNEETEDSFRSWTIARLYPDAAYSFDKLALDGAEIFRVSQITTARWLEKLCSDPGPCSKYRAEGIRAFWMVRLK